MSVTFIDFSLLVAYSFLSKFSKHNTAALPVHKFKAKSDLTSIPVRYNNPNLLTKYFFAVSTVRGNGFSCFVTVPGADATENKC